MFTIKYTQPPILHTLYHDPPRMCTYFMDIPLGDSIYDIRIRGINKNKRRFLGLSEASMKYI